MSATIIRGDARALPLPDASVDLIVTSPPYYALRSYTDGGEHYDGQIGAEATPAEYINILVACTAEWARVLKPGGSIWVNLGDKYNSAASGQNGTGATTLDPNRGPKMYACERGTTAAGIGSKSLIGLPWRYVIRCIDDLGLILRAEVVWSKPNGLPESVTDRVRRSHETWFHLVKQPRYYSAIDHIRQPHQMPPQRRPNGRPEDLTPRQGRPRQAWSTAQRAEKGVDGHPLGALPGSVWEIPTEPLIVPDHLGVDHFAAFPTEWPRRIILGWSPSGICTGCGEGRRPVATKSSHSPPSSAERVRANGHSGYAGFGEGKQWIHAKGAHPREGSLYDITGEVCGCPDPTAPTRPAVVADPFGGTGTTALVAHVLGRHGISVDMSADYCRLATWRTTDPGQIAKAMRVDKPAPQLAGQADLLAELDGGAA